MTFVNITQLLSWYFRRKWLRPPRMPGNHDLNKDQSGIVFQNTEKIYTAALKTKSALNRLHGHERAFLEKVFSKRDLFEVAEEMHLSERRIRQKKQIIFTKLQKICQSDGLFGRPHYDIPVFKFDGE